MDGWLACLSKGVTLSPICIRSVSVVGETSVIHVTGLTGNKRPTMEFQADLPIELDVSASDVLAEVK